LEASEKNLRDDWAEIDCIVVDFIAISSRAALAEPNLEALIDGEKKLQVELFVGNLACSESCSVGFHHRLEGTEALGSDTELSKKNVICNCEHVELHGHVVEIIDAFTSCLFASLISLTVIPLPCVRINYKVR
jgi:hypothetical protein